MLTTEYVYFVSMVSMASLENRGEWVKCWSRCRVRILKRETQGTKKRRKKTNEHNFLKWIICTHHTIVHSIRYIIRCTNGYVLRMWRNEVVLGTWVRAKFCFERIMTRWENEWKIIKGLYMLKSIDIPRVHSQQPDRCIYFNCKCKIRNAIRFRYCHKVRFLIRIMCWVEIFMWVSQFLRHFLTRQFYVRISCIASFVCDSQILLIHR